MVLHPTELNTVQHQRNRST